MPREKLTKAPDVTGRLAVTVTEAARLTGISPPSIRALIREGRLKGIQFGGGTKSKSFVIGLDSLKAFVNGEGR